MEPISKPESFPCLLPSIKDRPANIKDEVWQKAKELQCIPSSDGKDYRIKDLFDPSSKLLQQPVAIHIL
jgi:hypothetical protein